MLHHSNLRQRMSAPKLDRFIKDKTGEKVSMKTTSVNLEAKHMEFLKRKNLNLSALIREVLDGYMEDEENDSSDL